jgi:hypothetical protein
LILSLGVVAFAAAPAAAGPRDTPGPGDGWSVSLAFDGERLQTAGATVPDGLLGVEAVPRPGKPVTVELTAPLQAARWQLEARCGQVDWSAVASGAGAPPASVPWTRPESACDVRLSVVTAEGWVAQSPPRPLPGGAAAAQARITGKLFTSGGSLTEVLDDPLLSLCGRGAANPDELYQITATIAVRKGTSKSDREMRAAAATAQLSAALRRLNLADSRVTLNVTAGSADSFEVAILSAPAAEPSATPALLIDGDPRPFTITLLRPAGTPIQLDLTDRKGHHARVTLLP